MFHTVSLAVSPYQSSNPTLALVVGYIFCEARLSWDKVIAAGRTVSSGVCCCLANAHPSLPASVPCRCTVLSKGSDPSFSNAPCNETSVLSRLNQFNLGNACNPASSSSVMFILLRCSDAILVSDLRSLNPVPLICVLLRSKEVRLVSGWRCCSPPSVMGVLSRPRYSRLVR